MSAQKWLGQPTQPETRIAPLESAPNWPDERLSMGREAMTHVSEHCAAGS